MFSTPQRPVRSSVFSISRTMRVEAVGDDRQQDGIEVLMRRSPRVVGGDRVGGVRRVDSIR